MGCVAVQGGQKLESQACQPEHVRLESLIGMGTFGVVYKGRIDLLNTVVAVKVMAFHPTMEDVRMRRIAMELATLSRAKHHNVVDIIAHFPDCVRPPRSPTSPTAAGCAYLCIPLPANSARLFALSHTH